MRQLEPTVSVINSRAMRKWYIILVYHLLCTAVHAGTRLLRPKTPPSLQSLHMTSLGRQLGHIATLDSRRRAQTSGSTDDITPSPSMHPNGYPTASPSGSPVATPGQSPRQTSFPSQVPLSATPPPTASSITDSAPELSAHPAFAGTVSPSSGQDTPSHQNVTSHAPSLDPKQAQSIAPSVGLSEIPNSTSSNNLSTEPSLRPTSAQTESPSLERNTSAMTNKPSTVMTQAPSIAPSVGLVIIPAQKSSQQPFAESSLRPTAAETELPSLRSTPSLTEMPSERSKSDPTLYLSDAPSATETAIPTTFPSKQGTLSPSLRPSRADTEAPSEKPITSPSSTKLTHSPTLHPIHSLSDAPSFHVKAEPTSPPSKDLSTEHSLRPSFAETTLPASRPSMPAQGSKPPDVPTLHPDDASSNAPTVATAAKPTSWPSKGWSTEESPLPSLGTRGAQNNASWAAPNPVSSIYPTVPPTFDVASMPSGLQSANLSSESPSGCNIYGPNLCHGTMNISSYPTTNGTTGELTEEMQDWRAGSPSTIPTAVSLSSSSSKAPDIESTASRDSAAPTVLPASEGVTMPPSLRQTLGEAGSPTARVFNDTQWSVTPNISSASKDSTLKASVAPTLQPSQSYSKQAPSIWPSAGAEFAPTNLVGSAAASGQPTVIMSDVSFVTPTLSEPNSSKPSVNSSESISSSFPTPMFVVYTGNPTPPRPTPELTSPSIMPNSENATSQFPTLLDVPNTPQLLLLSATGSNVSGTEAPTIVPFAESRPSIVRPTALQSWEPSAPPLLSTTGPSSPHAPSQLPGDESSSGTVLPSASPFYTDSSSPSQSPTVLAWHKGNKPSRDCSWAGKRPEKRCKQMSDDGTHAYEKCEECAAFKPTLQPSQFPTLIDINEVSGKPSSDLSVVDTDHPSLSPSASTAASAYPSTEQTSVPVSVAPSASVIVTKLTPVPPGPTPNPTSPSMMPSLRTVTSQFPTFSEPPSSLRPALPSASEGKAPGTESPTIQTSVPVSVAPSASLIVTKLTPVPPGPTPEPTTPNPSATPSVVYSSDQPSMIPSASMALPSEPAIEPTNFAPSLVPTPPQIVESRNPVLLGPTAQQTEHPSMGPASLSPSPRQTAYPSHDVATHRPSLFTSSPATFSPLQLSHSPTVHSWWYKRGRPSRDCTWVGKNPEKRCADVSDDGTYAYEVCQECTGFIPTLEPSPLPTRSEIATSVPSSQSPVAYTGPPSTAQVVAPWPTIGPTFSPAPSLVPNSFPVLIPSASPTHAALRPSSPSVSPSSVSPVPESHPPTFSPWHKSGKPHQDCSWAGLKPERRCESKNDDGTYAYEVCEECAGFIPTPSPSQMPTEIDGGKPSVHPSTGSTRGPSLTSMFPSSAPWVKVTPFKPTVEPTFLAMVEPTLPSPTPSRLPIPPPSALPTHPPTSLAPSMFPQEFTKSPSLNPTDFPSSNPSSQPSSSELRPSMLAPFQETWLPTSRPWYKQGNPSFDCNWVAKRPEKRCNDKSDDGTHAFEKCEECATFVPTASPTQPPNVFDIEEADLTDGEPSSAPTVPNTLQPSTNRVTTSENPSIGPTFPGPSAVPMSVDDRNAVPPGPTTVAPSAKPQGLPSNIPSDVPSRLPSALPFAAPSGAPSRPPSPLPSASATHAPSFRPPSIFPTTISEHPSQQPIEFNSYSQPPATSSSNPPALAPSQQSESPSSEPWYQAGNPARDCSWVAQTPEQRCDTQSDDGTFAYESCAECGTFPPTPYASLHPTVFDIPSQTPSKKPSITSTGQPSMTPSEISSEPSIGPSSPPVPLPMVGPRTASPLVPSSSPTWTPTENPQMLPSSPASIESSVSPAGQQSSTPSPPPSSYPSVIPSASPALQPNTWIPSASPHSFSARPSRPLTANPSELPTLWQWHKAGEPSKDCNWVAELPQQRCDAKSEEGIFAYQNCDECARFLLTTGPSVQPTSRPSFNATLSPTATNETASREPTQFPAGRPWHRQGLSSEGCGWVEDDLEGRCHTIGWNNLYAFEACPQCAALTPSASPTGLPTLAPTSQPDSKVSLEPTLSVAPTASKPTPAEPSTQRPTSASPAREPTTESIGPTRVSNVSTFLNVTVAPTLTPTPRETAYPFETVEPTVVPTAGPVSFASTTAPSPASPTATPSSAYPTAIPSSSTSSPSEFPTGLPSSNAPSHLPTSDVPSSTPSLATSPSPTQAPTSLLPTAIPSTPSPTKPPSKSRPSTSSPSPAGPSGTPSLPPTSSVPTPVPTTAAPTNQPTTASPEPIPTLTPSNVGPTTEPTSGPSTGNPSRCPTLHPSSRPSAGQPTLTPTAEPNVTPTGYPSPAPNGESTPTPTAEPTTTPSTDPTVGPTGEPTTIPTSVLNPTTAPPTAGPKNHPTLQSPVWLPTHETVSVSTAIVLLGIQNAQFFKPEDEAIRSVLVHTITMLNVLDDVIRIKTQDFNVTTSPGGRRLRGRRFLNEDEGSILVEHESHVKVEFGSSAQQTGWVYLNELKSTINSGSLEATIHRIGNATNLSEVVVAADASIGWIDSRSMINGTQVVSPTASPTLLDIKSPTRKPPREKPPGHPRKEKKDQDGNENSKVKPGFMIGPLPSAILAPFCLLAVGFCCALAVMGIRAKAANVRYARERQPVEDRTIDSVNMMVATTLDARRDAVVDISFHAIDGDGDVTYADEDDFNDEDDDNWGPLDLRTCDTYQVRTRHRRIEWNDERRIGRIYWIGGNAAGRRFVRRFGSDNAVISTLSRLELVSTERGITLKWLSPSQRLRRDLDNSSNSEFGTRIAAFRHHAGNLRIHYEYGKVEFTVRRSYVFEDAVAALGSMPAEHWRRPFFVSFAGEDGLDAGGLSREFFRLCSIEAFGGTAGLFQNCHGTYHLRDDDDEDFACSNQQQTRLTFVGRLIAKALIEGHLLAAHLSLIVLKHLCCEPIALDDLQLIDCELWKNLSKLPKLAPSVIESLETPFVIDKYKQGRVITVELCPGGASRVVNSENVSEYLELCLKERVLDVCRRGLNALLRGFYSVIPLEILLLVSGHELELVLCGTPEIDVDEWRSSTVYRGAFAELRDRHPVVKSFWRVVASWDNHQRAVLLQWATGSSCVPCQGFAHLQGRDGAVRPFELSSIELSQAIYPRSHTCFNRIDLPLFETESALRSACDYVILNAEAHATFSLE